VIGVAEEQRAPREHPVEVAVSVNVVEERALAALHEERLVEPHRAHRPHGRVDAAGDQLERAAIEVGARRQAHRVQSLRRCTVRATARGPSSSS
jgi:hypothetical protein